MPRAQGSASRPPKCGSRWSAMTRSHSGPASSQPRRLRRCRRSTRRRGRRRSGRAPRARCREVVLDEQDAQWRGGRRGGSAVSDDAVGGRWHSGRRMRITGAQPPIQDFASWRLDASGICEAPIHDSQHARPYRHPPPRNDVPGRAAAGPAEPGCVPVGAGAAAEPRAQPLPLPSGRRRLVLAVAHPLAARALAGARRAAGAVDLGGDRVRRAGRVRRDRGPGRGRLRDPLLRPPAGVHRSRPRRRALTQTVRALGHRRPAGVAAHVQPRYTRMRSRTTRRAASACSRWRNTTRTSRIDRRTVLEQTARRVKKNRGLSRMQGSGMP